MRARWIGVVFAVLATVGLLALGRAEPGKKRADKDYAAELPRIPPKSPREAHKAFKIASGFRIELAAAEPLIRSPVALDIDEDGRAYVAEYPEYNQQDNPRSKARGAIKCLEDTDGDGVYDRVTVLADNLTAPVAVACWDGGVFVGAVPDVLYLKDTNGDGKADLRKVVYTGFDRDKAGEGMLNSFRWGLENRFHISTSIAGGNVKRVGDPKARPVSVRSRGFLFDPASLKFELTSGGGQHGMSMDDWGRKLVCDNSNPIHRIMYDGRYLTRNPYVQAPAAAVNIAEEARTSGLHRLSAPEPWRVVRTRLRVQGVVPGPVETGKASGHFTGCSGVTVYRGDAWPEAERNSVLVGEVSNNLVYRARLEPRGLGLTARRADKGQEFLASSDNWFRPVQFVNAPDGSLYVIDMYRELIETTVSIPPIITRHLDPASGIDRGRIWRIVPEDFKRRPQPKLSKANPAELVALLEHPNGWHRDTAARLLYQRQDRSAVPALEKLARTSKSPRGRLHALYALDGLKTLQPRHVLAALNDGEPRVREHALRLAERFAADHGDVRLAIVRLADDVDPGVRYQLAFSLSSIPGEAATAALMRLARRDGAERWVGFAIQTAARDRAGELARRVLADAKLKQSGAGRALLAGLAEQVGSANQAGEVATLLKALEDLPASDAALGRQLMAAFVAKLPPAARTRISAGKGSVLFRAVLADAVKAAGDRKRPPAERATAARTLALADFAQVRTSLAGMLEFREPEAVQRAALESLARFDRPEVAALVLDAWPGLSPKVRATAAETLFARPAWVGALLDAVEKGKVKTGEIDPARIALLKAFADPRVKARAEKLFAGTALSKRTEVVTAYRKALTLPGDASRGKALFKKVCSACHRLEGVGEPVGAELNAIRDRGNETILLNILDPNREVLPKFIAYYVVTDSGRTLTGLITSETANGLTLRRPDGTSETLLRVQIAELRSTGTSFMPEGLEQQIDVQGMADLLAYLNAVR